MAGLPNRRRMRTRSCAALLALAASGLALFGCGGSDSGDGADEGATKTVEVANKETRDEIQHVYVKGGSYVDGARVVAAKSLEAKPKPKPKPLPKPTKAQLAGGPNGMPPASVGSNGSYKPKAHRRLPTSTMAGVGDLPPERSAILIGRTALAPPSAPAAVNRAIGAANAIVGQPYVWGGGHGSWRSRGYDCSGSVSYALGGAGLLNAPLTSGALESWGEPGPGKWITVYANAGHTYAVIAGLRWDTVGDAHGTGPRWHAEVPYPKGFTVRHPAGL